MITARIAHIAVLALIIPVAALVFPQSAWAASGNVQVCQPNASCTVGEFLYDDSYAPITVGATCTITSRYPNGTLFLDAVGLNPSAESDGWYAHAFTAPATTGLYRTEIKCTVGTQTLALDKSFEVKADPTSLTSGDVTSAVWGASRTSNNSAGTFGEALQNSVPTSDDIASSVWGYSNRTLSTFNSLITDIWSNPTRTLSGFGTLVADIWANTTRTLTGADLSSGSLATKSNVDSIDTHGGDITTIKSDVSSIKDTVGKINTNTTTTVNNISNVSNIQNVQNINNMLENMLEQIVNKPIIENGLENGSSTTTIDLQSKLDKSTSLANQMLSSSNYLKAKVNLIHYQGKDLNSDTLNSLLSVVGSETDDTSANSLFGQLNWIKNQWDLPVSEKLSKQLVAVNQNLTEGKTTTASIDNLIKLIGTKGDASKNTLFGSLNEKKELAQALDKSYSNINNLLKNWNYSTQDAKELADKQILGQVLALSKEVQTLNLLPKVTSLLTFQPSSKLTQKEVRNQALDLRGIVEANKEFLAINNSQPFSSIWLGEGSIVFKTLITNPSKILTQTVPLKYYLPKEVTKDDVIKIDEGLSVNYDMEKDQYFVKGEFTLAPKESKTILVTVDDNVFHINDQEIATMRRQAQELSEPLKNTAYFAQGVTLKSDIDASLDRVETLQKDGITPEAKIKAYRDAQIEYKASQQKLEKLKELATSAGSVGTLFGFVGGAQVMAVWGLIIIMVAGFVFLALYMKSIRAAGINGVETAPMQLSEKIGKKEKEGSRRDDVVNETKRHFFSGPVKLAIIIISFTVLGGVVMLGVRNSSQKRSEVAYQKPVTREPQATASAVLAATSEDSKTEEKVTIFVPKDSIVSIYRDPSLNAPVLADLKVSQEALQINQQETWIKVKVEQIEGWVDIDFIEKKDVKSDASPSPKPQGGISESQGTVTIKNTPTGFLRVRDNIWGQEITKVSPGETFTSLQEKSGWVQILLEDGTKGWVTKEYVTLP